jgi:hypothetical protein
MMTMLLIAGFAVLAVGLLAIALGIPVKEFSFGNTLILTGAIAACTGVILLGLSVVVRELQNIARRLGPANANAHAEAESRRAAGQPAFPPQDGAKPPLSAAASGSRQEDATARPREDVSSQSPPEPAAPPKPRRNLLFSSSRKDRERAGEGPAQAASESPHPAPSNPPVQPPVPAATFDDAWPQSERGRSDALRRARPATSAEPAAAAAAPESAAPAAPAEEPAPVTVLKSGVVDGMAYSLYSDGSIEAQMPEGMMRFASIDELRSHLDHRP